MLLVIAGKVKTVGWSLLFALSPKLLSTSNYVSALARLWSLIGRLSFFGHALYINEDRSFRSYILDFLYVSEGKRVFVHGANKNCIFGSDKFSSPVLFLRINGAS